MSLYSVVVVYNHCEHCAGDGYVREYIDCPVCCGDSIDDDERCERCWNGEDGFYGQIQVSEVLCRFCENSTESFCTQFEVDSLEECIEFTKIFLKAHLGYDSSEDNQLEMDKPLDLNERNNWIVLLSDDCGDYECFIIKTA